MKCPSRVDDWTLDKLSFPHQKGFFADTPPPTPNPYCKSRVNQAHIVRHADLQIGATSVVYSTAVMIATSTPAPVAIHTKTKAARRIERRYSFSLGSLLCAPRAKAAPARIRPSTV